jgi:hypothetical protein
MGRPTKRLMPDVDVMEPRTMLTTGAPLLSVHALHGVVHDVRSIFGTLIRTGDTGRAGAALTGLSSRIPLGSEQLAPTWLNDLELYRPHAPGSGVRTEARILGDLYRYVRGGAGGGLPAPVPGATNPPVSNPGPGGGGNTGGAGVPAPTQSLDSVRIQNTTGLNLRVTVYLRVPQVQQPWITELIPAGGDPIVSFDFGTATGSFMTMNVSMANGSLTPPPLSNLSLDQPIGGYDGTLFTISLFGSYFNVTPG